MKMDKIIYWPLMHKCAKMGADSYYSGALYLYNEFSKDKKKYSQSAQILEQFKRLEYMYIKHRNKLFIIEWKKWINDFNTYAGHYWFFDHWEDLRHKYLNLTIKKMDELEKHLKINK